MQLTATDELTTQPSSLRALTLLGVGELHLGHHDGLQLHAAAAQVLHAWGERTNG